MKNPDLNNFMPIDKIKVLKEYCPYIFKTDLESPVCFVDHSKIDYSLYEEKQSYQQGKMRVTVFKILDMEKARSSNFREGFEEKEISLSSIGDIKIYK